MNHHISTAIRRLTAFLRGEPVRITEEFVQTAIDRYRVRSTSMRGVVIVVGDWLVLLADHTGTWTAQKLPWSPAIATQLGHEHRISSITLPDGKDVLQCVTCGSEW